MGWQIMPRITLGGCGPVLLQADHDHDNYDHPDDHHDLNDHHDYDDDDDNYDAQEGRHNAAVDPVLLHDWSPH